MPVMISLRDMRLTNTAACIVPVKANIPVHIPGRLYEDAVAAGMVETDKPLPGQEVEAPAKKAEDGPEQDPEVAALEAAVTKVMIEGADADFKDDGTPKVKSVINELSPDAKTPTATEIAETYERLQDNISLAER